MEKELDLSVQNISISDEMESSFIDYAMSVIISRAIPDVRDGLKPVHRRILYAMYGLEMNHNNNFKKSARAVGEVIAKYHPHGDSSVYDALVRLAQPFSMRYPLILGQGNFGSIDGDSAAAMRYTEAKLEKISALLLEDIKRDTVDFQENYDGSEIEPKVLPSKIPNLLINGSTGIAVGMATSIPPHNLGEVLSAAKHLLKNPEADIDDLMKYIIAPDFPTGGIIINKKELPEVYKNGRGRILVRAKTNFEQLDSSNPLIVISEIPYMVNKSQLILKIVELVKLKTIESIADIRDETNRKGIRIVIKLKRGFIPEVELNKLFKLTQLQSSFSVNSLAIYNDRPHVMNLKTILSYYLAYQDKILVRKTKFNLLKSEARRHILNALKVAVENIKVIISLLEISKNSQSAIKNLIEKFNFDEIQTRAILEMRLQRLTGLEKENLNLELEDLNKKIIFYNLVLASKTERDRIITEEINKISNDFSDERRTKLSNKEYDNITDEDLIPKEDVVITITDKDYIKRLPIESYHAQKRGGVGSRAVNLSEEDYTKNIIIANTHTDLLIFTSLGKIYKLRVHQIPERLKNAKGVPIVNLVKLEKNEKVASILSVDDYDQSDLFFVTKKGTVKKTNIDEFLSIQRNGKRAITLKDDNELLGVLKISSKYDVEILLGNSNGKAIRFLSNKIRRLGRSAAGVRGINVEYGHVVDYTWALPNDLILSLSEKGYGKLTNVNEYRITNRGGKGVKTINSTKSGKLIGLRSVHGSEDILIIKSNGVIIRTNLDEVANTSRNTKGVSIVKLKESERVVALAVVESGESLEEEIKDKTVEGKIINSEREQEDSDD